MKLPKSTIKKLIHNDKLILKIPVMYPVLGENGKIIYKNVLEDPTIAGEELVEFPDDWFMYMVEEVPSRWGKGEIYLSPKGFQSCYKELEEEFDRVKSKNKMKYWIEEEYNAVEFYDKIKHRAQKRIDKLTMEIEELKPYTI